MEQISSILMLVVIICMNLFYKLTVKLFKNFLNHCKLLCKLEMGLR